MAVDKSLVDLWYEALITKISGNFPIYHCRTDTFKHSFFPWTIVAWNKVHPEIRNASLTVFKKHLWKEIDPASHSVYNICYPNGRKLLTRLRIGLSHLNEHRFNHNFKNCINPLCTCSLEVESTFISSCTAITMTLSDICLMSFVKLMLIYRMLLMRNW